MNSYEDEIYKIYKEIRKAVPDHGLVKTVFTSVLKSCKARYENESIDTSEKRSQEVDPE